MMAALLLLLAAPPASDLASIQAEPNLERRASRLTAYADRRVDGLRKLYREAKWEDVEAALTQIAEACELAARSLFDTGKNPSRSPKHFKRAELAMRGLLRRLDTFGQEVSFEERPAVEKARGRVQHVHRELLDGIMGKNKGE